MVFVWRLWKHQHHFQRRERETIKFLHRQRRRQHSTRSSHTVFLRRCAAAPSYIQGFSHLFIYVDVSFVRDFSFAIRSHSLPFIIRIAMFVRPKLKCIIWTVPRLPSPPLLHFTWETHKFTRTSVSVFHAGYCGVCMRSTNRQMLPQRCWTIRIAQLN